jgi:hypothetical protein
MTDTIDRAKPVYIRCDCYTAYHCLVIDEDPDLPGELYVSFVSTRHGSIWHRIRWALKHVFGRQDLCFADIIIKRSELAEALNGGQQDG